ncbi:MAG: hypothetical protein Ct9H300mP8_10080 [Gammaproteobacteria bacterium]|nr:MAG: hypothetical protein Ct9H300mP8_10080 [Gammaproteobacteria bacterium]
MIRGTAQVFLGIQVSDLEERKNVVNVLTKRGYVVDDMTDNEMAKLHVRHMVGGFRLRLRLGKYFTVSNFQKAPVRCERFCPRLGRLEYFFVPLQESWCGLGPRSRWI